MKIDRPRMAAIIRAFMGQYRIPGLSVAIARQGELIYEEGFGFADPASEMTGTIRCTRTPECRPLQFAPGTHYLYSNFGNCLFGRVIEKITGQTYSDFLQQTLLRQCRINGMSIDGNKQAERLSGEAVYYDQGSGNPYTIDLRRMDSHGGKSILWSQ